MAVLWSAVIEGAGLFELDEQQPGAGESAVGAELELAARVVEQLGVEAEDAGLERPVEPRRHSAASYPLSVSVLYPPLLVVVYCFGPPCIPLLKSIIPPYPAYGIPHLRIWKIRCQK